MAKDLEKFPGKTPRMYACDTKTPETVTLLLEKGANINAKSYDCWTPWMTVCISWHPCPEIVTLLLEKGANARATAYEGKRAIDHYKKNTSYNNPVTLQELEIATEGW